MLAWILDNPGWVALCAFGAIAFLVLLSKTVRYIPNTRVGHRGEAHQRQGLGGEGLHRHERRGGLPARGPARWLASLHALPVPHPPDVRW